MKNARRALTGAAAVALTALAVLAPTAGAYSSGRYRGHTNRAGGVSFRVSGGKVRGFTAKVRYRCTDGDRPKFTEHVGGMRIRHGRFSGHFKQYRGAERLSVSGRLAGRSAAGRFAAKLRYDRHGYLNHRGSIVCRTRTLRFKATGPAARPAPIAIPPTPAPGSGARVELSCSALSGAGSFSHPLVIGTVTRNTLVRGCAPLTSGTGFDITYFAFTLRSPAPSGALVASLFQLTPSAISAVHPRLATSGGVTLETSRSNGVWVGDPNAPSGRALPIGGLPAGSYRLGMEKLDSPLRSVTTPPYNVAIAFDPNHF